MTDAVATAFVDVRMRWDDKQGKAEVSGGLQSTAQQSQGKAKQAGTLIGSNLVKGFAAVWAGGQALQIGADLLTLGNEVEAWQTKVDTVFGDQAATVEAWADANNEALGLTDERLAGLAARTGDLLVPMGFARDEAAGMSTDVLELSGALSAWSEGQYESADVAEILTKAMLGERDGLKALGISISEADIQARLAAKGQSDLTGAALEQAKAQATLELVTEKSTDAQAAWADGTFDAVKQQNELKAGIAEVKQSIAVALLPAFQAVTAFIVEQLIPAIREWWPVFVEAFAFVAEKGQELADWFMVELWPTIEEAMTAIREVIEVVVAVISELWALWGDELTQLTENALAGILNYIETGFDVIKGLFEFISALLRGDWSAAWSALGDVVGAVMSGMLEAIRLALSNIAQVFSMVWDGIKLTVGGAIDALVGFVTALPGRIVTAVAGAFDPIIDGLRATWNRVAGFLNGIRFTFEGVDMPGPIPDVPGFTVDPIPSIPTFAEGGVLTAPTLGLFGETARARPEIVTPQRIMADTFRKVLAEQGSGPITVQVFLGDEQLEPHTVRVVDRSMRRLHANLIGGRR